MKDYFDRKIERSFRTGNKRRRIRSDENVELRQPIVLDEAEEDALQIIDPRIATKLKIQARKGRQ